MKKQKKILTPKCSICSEIENQDFNFPLDLLQQYRKEKFRLPNFPCVVIGLDGPPSTLGRRG